MSRSLRQAFCLLVLAASARSASAKPCPNIMLVLDQSGSMAADTSGHPPDDPGFQGPSKWELLQSVISDVVKQYGGRVPFGLELFTSQAYHDQVQCEAAATITVPISHSTSGDLIARIMAAKPDAETDTGEAIKRAAAEPSLHDKAKANYIVLVTDGSPNCNPTDAAASVSTPDQGLTPDYTYAQIEAALKQSPSIKTFVIGFDGDPAGVNTVFLDGMAGKGGARVPGCQGSLAMPPTPCYYRAGVNGQAFKDVFDMIVTEAGGGEFGGALCDDSCVSTGCPKGQVCTTDEQNVEPHCANDPCGGKVCTGNQFCRGGACASACTKACATGQVCKDGTCVADKCATAKCPTGQGCNANTGACVANNCPACGAGYLCDVASGNCIVDQCTIVTCPAGTKCSNNGNCAPMGGGGCSASGTGPSAPVGPAATLGLGLALLFAFAGFLYARQRRST